MASPPPPPTKPVIDRQTTTPFLLKLFYRTSTYHHLSDFSPAGPQPPHLQIYTWPSCSLRELTHLLVSALPSLLPTPAVGTRIVFRLVFPDTRGAAQAREGAPGRYTTKELGSVVVGEGEGEDAYAEQEGDANGDEADREDGDGAAKPRRQANGRRADLENLSGDADKTLAEARFVIGDYVACAIFPPLPDGSVAAAPAPPPSGRGFGMGRGAPPVGRENGFGGDRGFGGGDRGYGGGDRGYGRGRDRGYGGGYPSRGGGGRLGYEGPGGVPSGEWRRGEVPEGPGPGVGYGRGRGRSRGW